VLLLFVATLTLAAIRVRPQNLALKRACIDLLGGVILPILCFIFDPILREGAFHQYGNKVAAEFFYTAVSIQIIVFLVWRLAGRWTSRDSAEFVAGVLWVGAGIAFVVGVLLSLFSLLGLLVYGIGALGFTPFLTATVFARNAIRAMRRANDGGRVVVLMFLGAGVAIAVPVLLYGVVGPPILAALSHIVGPQTRFPFP
jgi:hypothetical protein